jgi:hypothetical protein
VVLDQMSVPSYLRRVREKHEGGLAGMATLCEEGKICVVTEVQLYKNPNNKWCEDSNENSETALLENRPGDLQQP